LAERLQQTHESEDVGTLTSRDPSREIVEIQTCRSSLMGKGKSPPGREHCNITHRHA
jgi:hypothetical protein